MKRIFSNSFRLVVLFMLLAIMPVDAQALPSTIRVGILSNQQQVFISTDTEFEALNSNTGQVLARFSAGEKVNIIPKGKVMMMNGQQITGDHIKFSPSQKNKQHDMKINGKQYRGAIELHITHGKEGITVVNTVGVEQYLYGVIAKEMSPNWPMEALKAQTVAARSYTLYNLNRHQDDEYDVCATNDCQVYGGRENETSEIIKAVDATAGQVITYKDKLIPANFHSSSGGYTENSENVWGTYQPYLRGVVDYDQKSPHYKWEKSMTVSQLQEVLQAAGYQIGTIKAVELSPLTRAGVDTPDRGVSGRVKAIRFIGSNGNAKLTGDQLRKILKLKSTLFDISIVAPVAAIPEFEITKNIGELDRKKIEINLPPQKEETFLVSKKELHYLSDRLGEIILITGFGWGHGLGLSQWGAKAMAEQGPQTDTTYYKEILKHYYQGTLIKKVF